MENFNKSDYESIALLRTLELIFVPQLLEINVADAWDLSLQHNSVSISFFSAKFNLGPEQWCNFEPQFLLINS